MKLTRCVPLVLAVVLVLGVWATVPFAQAAPHAAPNVPTAITNPSDVLPTPPLAGAPTDTPAPTGTASAPATDSPTSISGPTNTSAPIATRGPTATAAPTATDAPTRTPKPTASVGERPDACERNNDREHPCTIAADTVSGPYTFVPAGDQDWYVVDLGQPTGLATAITVRGTGNLDLLASLSRTDGSAVGSISSPVISATLDAAIGGPVVIHVENRDPDDATGATYNIEVRHVLPPAPDVSPEVLALRQMKPDPLENDWNVDTAAPIGVGFVYTLNFVCPDPALDACAGGDHDYLRLAVKAHMTYDMATFDLGPGVDTVLDLFWGSEDVPVASNDDAGPIGFASLLRWTAPSDGDAILRVGPRTGALKPLVFDPQASSYHVAVALDGSDLAKQILERVQTQTQPVTPTPQPVPIRSGGGGGGGGSAPVQAAPVAQAPPVQRVPTAQPTPMPAVSDVRAGHAQVIVPTTILRAAPDGKADGLAELHGDTVVTLLGQAQGVWVRVQTADGVLPGWVDSRDIRRVDGAGGTGGATTPLTATGSLTTTATSTAPFATATPAPAALVTRLDPVPPAALPALPARSTLVVSVTILTDAANAPTPVPGSLHPTVVPSSLRAGVRVQLMNALGDVLAEAVTPASGQVTLIRDLQAGTAVWVRLPAMGLDVPVDPSNPVITIRVRGSV